MNLFKEKVIDYVLMNKDTCVCRFEAIVDEFDEVNFEIKEQMGIMPLGFTDIQDFIENRRAPKTRKHVTELLTKSGCINLITFLDVTMALSLNDTFWIKRTCKKVAWEEVSLYRNEFNEVIAQVAFEGNEFSQSTSSPEYTTNGVSAKCWHRYDDIYLCKKNSEGTFEAVSEYYASQIFKAFCVSAVEYRINYLHDKLVSECKIFTNEEFGFISCNRLFSTKLQIKDYLNYYSKFPNGEDFFRRMLIADALVLNVDRHRGNFGFIIANDTQKIVKPAPVFDFNRCLLFDTANFTNDYFKKILPRIGTDFNTVANQLLTDDIKKDLIELRGFMIKPTSITDTRADIMSFIVNKQIDNILAGKALYYCKFF